jgi:hypothetical protein
MLKTSQGRLDSSTSHLILPGLRKASGRPYLTLRISTTSRFAVPRFITSCLPSRDRSKLRIVSLLKWVICYGGSPVTEKKLRARIIPGSGRTEPRQGDIVAWGGGIGLEKKID